MVLLQLCATVVALVTISLTYFKWKYLYWSRRNVPYLEPKIPFGTSANPFKRRQNIGFRLKHHYDIIKAKGWKHGGLYLITSPTYLLVDLDYIKNVMAKDFNYFIDRDLYVNEKDDPISAHLFNMTGEKWRKLRAKLTPTFTSGKMKLMFQTLVTCAPNLLERIDKVCKEEGPVDIKEVLGCFTTDIIGSCAFGLDCNTFKEEDSPFREYGKKIFTMKPSQMLKMLTTLVAPGLAKALGITLTPKDVSDFFTNVVKDTVAYREDNDVTKKDFLQLLIDLKKNQALTIEEVAAQSFVFFVAGFETSSTTMTFALYELGRRADIQERVRREIHTVMAKYNGLTYDAVQEMKYLDQVINETLRMYPPVTFFTRKCVKDYKVPDVDVVIEKGTSVMIPVLGVHYDPEYYPEPEKFDPERFTEENRSSRHNYAHIPFGEGPRICIGMRFGLMQTKVGLALLLKDYKFGVSGKTQEPLRMKVNSFVLAAEGEIWLSAKKI